jgi:DNA-binding transcriptional LysR family regulator
MRIELRQLRHLLALDRFRNFARAAEAIGLTQPALTRSIQTVEDAVGTRLFDRNHSRVEPTLAGAMLIREAHAVLDRAADMERTMRRIVDVRAGRLRIGAGPMAADGSVSIAVGRMLERHPDVRISVAIEDWPQLTDRVLSGDIEFAVAEISLARKEPRLTVEELPQHRCLWFCRRGHPLTKQARITTDDLRRFPLASPTIPARLANAVGRWPSSDVPDESGEVTSTEMQTSGLQMIRQVVRQTDAIGLGLSAQLRDDMARGIFVEFEVDGPPAFTNYGIISLGERTLSPAAELFIGLLREVEREISEESARVATGNEGPIARA